MFTAKEYDAISNLEKFSRIDMMSSDDRPSQWQEGEKILEVISIWYISARSLEFSSKDLLKSEIQSLVIITFIQ